MAVASVEADKKRSAFIHRTRLTLALCSTSVLCTFSEKLFASQSEVTTAFELPNMISLLLGFHDKQWGERFTQHEVYTFSIIVDHERTLKYGN